MVNVLYEAGWDGTHCAFIYTEQVFLDWPGTPTFKGETK